MKKRLGCRGWTMGCMRAHESGSEERAARVRSCCESVKNLCVQGVKVEKGSFCFFSSRER